MAKVNQIGKKYGSVTVIEKTNEKKYNRPLYLCRCDCGKEFLCGIRMLTSGDRTSCGCKRRLDLTNKKFGRLTAIEQSGLDDRGNVLWKCRCDCGNERFVPAASLTSDKTKSCGCVREEKSHIPKHRTDYTGQKFGYLTVIEKLDEKIRPGEYLYLCECECGKQIKSVAGLLLSGDKVSCGCKRRDDLVGQRFGRWTVLEYIGDKKHKCRCDCGNIGEVQNSMLKSGRSQSCGCLARELTSKNKLKDIRGLRSGKLVAVRLMNKRDNSKRCVWECKCDCGRTSYVRGQDLSAQTTQSCGNCGTYVKGIRVSKPQLELHRLIGRGVVNFKTKCGLRPDIAFIHNGRKIAVEYDEKVWHDEAKDLEKTKRLLKDGWKVIRLFVDNKEPNKTMMDDLNKFLNIQCSYSRIKYG